MGNWRSSGSVPMTNLLDSIHDPVKILLIGENGAGKTGSLASLVCMGYKLRVIDTDKGIKTLKSFITDEHYPTARWIKSKGIDLTDAVYYKQIDIPMSFRRVIEKDSHGKIARDETLLAPKNAEAWNKACTALVEWNEGDKKLGGVIDWDDKTIVVIDSFSTLSMMAYYMIQQLNGRLGAREDGYDFQRDVGAAQGQLRRLLEMLSSSGVRCNVVLISHITRVDVTQGFAQSPEQRARENRPIDAKGYPAAIGRALSPHMGKFYNDVYQVEQTGSGTAVQRKISTVPINNVAAKNSVYLDTNYPVSTGLAEIFAAHRGEPSPQEFIKFVRGTNVPAPKP